MAPEKFRKRYRIPSARKRNWDYRSKAIYFITICTQHRLPYFGKIVNGDMILSDLGQIATKYWNDIPNHFPFVELLNFVVMPNHIHGLVEIRDNHNNNCNDNTVDKLDDDIVETLHATSLQPPFTEPSQPPQRPFTEPPPPPKNESMAGISPKRGSLASVMRSFKSAVTRFANRNNIEFGWQERYHDHIVQNNGEFIRINKYINNNPRKWNNDDLNL